jgi:hypothetical protein
MVWPLSKDQIEADDLATAEILRNMPDDKYSFSADGFLTNLTLLVSPGRRRLEAEIERSERLQQQERPLSGDKTEAVSLPSAASILAVIPHSVRVIESRWPKAFAELVDGYERQRLLREARQLSCEGHPV